jgi:hypothetical protein
MSTQYREDKQRRSRTAYQTSYPVHNSWDLEPSNCPGSCSCEPGSRTQYDRMQYTKYVTGQPQTIPTVMDVPGWK